MTVKISSDHLDFIDASLSTPPSDAELRSLFGIPREEPIVLHGGGVRTRCVFDEHGVVIHREETTLETSAMFFALSEADTPGSPARRFLGSILLGDVPVVADLAEARLPKSGSIPLHSAFPHSWSFHSSFFIVHLEFRRRRTGGGKRSGVHRLAYVSLSFPSNPVP
jgi:hypothetical protein